MRSECGSLVMRLTNVPLTFRYGSLLAFSQNEDFLTARALSMPLSSSGGKSSTPWLSSRCLCLPGLPMRSR